ncbi:hypothetical protein CH063_10952 [Colletotrichum higginsianum]|uniref:Uncharacterized protein n=1 Tax=Colletotrichum higginsianum (strain IMI 349063) TaxID=759273 RepID=H1VJG1_COLHI|nr:hypothetical protein CH063_10952 [Colletotrichum higginsianum]
MRFISQDGFQREVERIHVDGALAPDPLTICRDWFLLVVRSAGLGALHQFVLLNRFLVRMDRRQSTLDIGLPGTETAFALFIRDIVDGNSRSVGIFFC